MKGSVVGPLAFGGVSGVAGAALTAWSGAPLILAFLAYSFCGAAGVLLGGALNFRLAEPAEARRDDAALATRHGVRP